jgi:hypothetical protein
LKFKQLLTQEILAVVLQRRHCILVKILSCQSNNSNKNKMVFCCFSCNDPELDAAVPEKKVSIHYSSSDWADTPGTYYRTAGNALSGTPPPGVSVQPATAVQVVPQPTGPKPEQLPPQSLIAGECASKEILRQCFYDYIALSFFFFYTTVTVPSGVRPGQTLRVQYGDGKVVEVQVPVGMTAGSTFYVEAKDNNNPFTSENSLLDDGKPVSPPPFSQALDDLDSRHRGHPFNNKSTTAITPISPPPSDPVPFSDCLDDVSDGYGRPSYTSTLGKKVVRVTVPPHTRPGSTIHVKIPGEEHRIVAAVVPPSCTEFNVTYDPRPTRRNKSPLKHFTSHEDEKLLLVRVPPGVAAGQTLHVQIPGEPGRVIQAVVPSGNVRQFHVSYTPQR